jgi:Fe2+ transport system protein FeoA
MNRESLFSLTEVPIGRRVRVRHLSIQPEIGFRLRELGFRENAVIQCINKGDGTIICDVCNARIGLNGNIAAKIVVSAFE